MLFMLGAEANGNGIGMTILLGILVVLMIVYLIFGTINRKKQQEQAMKMMNEIEAEVSGRVVEICVADGQSVEYGQVLMYVE